MSGISQVRSLSTPPAPVAPGSPAPASVPADPSDSFTPSVQMPTEDLTKLVMAGGFTSAMDAFFGPAPKSEMRRTRDNYTLSQGGWKVSIPDPAPTVRGVEMPLPDKDPVGAVRGDGPPAGHLPLAVWTRVDGGWVSESDGKPADAAARLVRSSHLSARLGDDGSFTMQLRLDRTDGSLVDWVLDGKAFLENPGKWPPIAGVDKVKPPSPQEPGAPAEPPAPPQPEIREEGEWIVIDRVKLPRGPG